MPDFQIEIASVEHPRLLAAALDEAGRRNVRLGRVSQGSGMQLLSASERVEMLDLAHANDVQLFLFVSVRNSFEPLTDPAAGDQIRGEAAFADAVSELQRCASAGIDGVLIPDVGLLAVAGKMRRQGDLGMLQLKTSIAIAPQNAATAALYEQLGATSINVANSSSLPDLIEMRKRLHPETLIDIYVEAPEHLGGGLRYRELAEIVSGLAPVSLKFGLRNAPTLYPYGAHLEPVAEQTIREKVRRAELALAILASPDLAIASTIAG